MPKEKKIKYDYSNPESQKLFEEFTLLLADITRHVEEREQYIQTLEVELSETKKIKNMFKSIIKRLPAAIYKVMSKFVKEIFFKIVTFWGKLKNVEK